MSTLRTKPGRKSGNKYMYPTSKGAVWANGHPPRGTTPKQTGSKLSRRVGRRIDQKHLRGGGL